MQRNKNSCFLGQILVSRNKVNSKEHVYLWALDNQSKTQSTFFLFAIVPQRWSHLTKLRKTLHDQFKTQWKSQNGYVPDIALYTVPQFQGITCRYFGFRHRKDWKARSKSGTNITKLASCATTGTLNYLSWTLHEWRKVITMVKA